LLDMVQDLVDRLDAFDAEFAGLRRQVAEDAIQLQDLRVQADANREKAQAYDKLRALLSVEDAS